MALLDFKEIPEGNGGDGLQDTFELFAREFFEKLGFQIDDGPDRGADGGRDLIIIETRAGNLGNTNIRWLVSCKHYAHSGNSVGIKDEIDILGRLDYFNCDGFIGFYSTLPSSGLSDRINSCKSKKEVCIFDCEKIERVLLENPELVSLVKRFFPKSYKKQTNQIGPVKIFDKYYPLKCEVCGKDLIKKGVADDYMGIVVLVQDMDFYEKTKGGEKITQVYSACKGNCDRIMESRINSNEITKWEDISDLLIPYQYLKWITGIINQMREGNVIFTDDAFEQIKDITLKIAQVVMRQPSVKEIQRSRELQEWLFWK